jgi:hypothetical protein
MANLLQLKVKGRIKPTREETDILVIEFSLGPLRFIIIGNVPPDGQEEAVAYIKMKFSSKPMDWKEAIHQMTEWKVMEDEDQI